MNRTPSRKRIVVVHIARGSFLCLASFLLLSCATTTYRDVYPTLTDGKYDSEFPYRGCSEQLEEITESVRMINCVAYYKRFIYPFETRATKSDFTEDFPGPKAAKEIVISRTSSGSATIVYYDHRHVALLTCAHVVYFPDTVVTFYIGEDHKPTKFVRCVEIKDRQTNYVSTLSGLRDLDILAKDNVNDIALVGQQYDAEPTAKIPVFNYPLGRAKDLEWGAFVYLFGYPSGFRIVTKGIVSSPNKDKTGSFLVDAVFNRGFSGGIILAVRDGVPNFELVGMVKTVLGHTEYYLSPAKEGESLEYDSGLPYKGEMYVDSRTEIEYGVTQAVSAESVASFVKEHQEELLNRGYDLRSFVEKPPQKK